MRVKPFSSLLSDVHNAIHVSLNFAVEIRDCSNSVTAQYNSSIPNMYTSVPKSWIVDETITYRNCVEGKINVINRLENQLKNSNNITQGYIDNVVDTVGEIFVQSAKEVFGVKKHYNACGNYNKINLSKFCGSSKVKPTFFGFGEGRSFGFVFGCLGFNIKTFLRALFPSFFISPSL